MRKRIICLLRPGEIIFLLTLSLLSLLANLGLLGSAAWLISSAALLPPLYALTLGITAVRALGISRALLRYGERYFTHKSAFAALVNIRLRLYDKINLATNFPAQSQSKGLSLNALLTKADILHDFLLRGFLPPITLFGAVLMVSCLLFPLLSYMALALPLLYIVHYLPLWAPSATDDSTSYRSQLLDAIQGRHELQMAGSAENFAHKLDLTALQWQQHRLKYSRQNDRIDLQLSLLRFLIFVLFFARLILAVNRAEISGITMALYLVVLLALLNELSSLPSALRNFRQAQTAASWLTEDKTCAPAANCKISPDLVTVSELSFSYPQGLPVFSGLNFSLAAGCHTAIIGDSGSGKTTLAYLLAGLWQPTQGNICYKNSSSPFVCAIPQDSCIFAASIRENFLRLHPAISEQAIYDALQTAQLTNLIKSLPAGIDTPLGENACHLSGGERNRLLSALILASTAPVLLFDEPTAGLDHLTAETLLTAIISRANLTGQTVLVITHDLPQLHKFHQVIQLSPK